MNIVLHQCKTELTSTLTYLIWAEPFTQKTYIVWIKYALLPKDWDAQIKWVQKTPTLQPKHLYLVPQYGLVTVLNTFEKETGDDYVSCQLYKSSEKVIVNSGDIITKIDNIKEGVECWKHLLRTEMVVSSHPKVKEYYTFIYIMNE